MFNRIKIYFRMKTYNLRKRIQRFIRGYAYSDVWDIDAWFMNTLKPMLIHLRDHGIGIPMDLYQEGAENERKKWEIVLTEMISLLTLMDEDEARKHLEIYDSDYSIESYQKVNDFMEDTKNRFFELFSKYFYNLWD